MEIQLRANERLKGISVGERLSYNFYDGTLQGMSLLFVEPKKGNPTPRECDITGKRLTEALGLPTVFILTPSPTYEHQRLMDKGIYYKPIVTSYGTVYPTVDKIVKAIAKRENAKILPTGETALHALGFSTQVPTKPVYLTTGTQHVVKIGTKTITLRRCAPSNLRYKSRLMPVLILVLKAKERDNIGANDI